MTMANKEWAADMFACYLNNMHDIKTEIQFKSNLGHLISAPNGIINIIFTAYNISVMRKAFGK